MQVFTCLSHRNRIPFDATSSLLDQNEGQGPFSGALAPPLGASPSSISTHQRLSAVAPAYIYIYYIYIIIFKSPETTRSAPSGYAEVSALDHESQEFDP